MEKRRPVVRPGLTNFEGTGGPHNSLRTHLRVALVYTYIIMNEHATRINLHEHEDDEKGNGLCNVIASYAACAYRKGN